jgi:hypothetical protein
VRARVRVQQASLRLAHSRRIRRWLGASRNPPGIESLLNGRNRREIEVFPKISSTTQVVNMCHTCKGKRHRLAFLLFSI